ncbi:MAG: hypothetical protein R3A51_00140 [Nannocystaceae bacterium]
MQPSPSDRLCERFELLREQAEGTGSPLLGRAWAAMDRELGEVVHVTLLDAELLPSDELRATAASQARALIGLCEAGDDSGLVPVAFADVHEDLCFVVHEPLYGAISLTDVGGARAADPTEQFTELARFIEHGARALATLHGRGLIHGLVGIATAFAWEGGHALWQYGLAPLCDADALARRDAGRRLLAPEFAERRVCTPAADVFGWAATVVALASGRPRGAAIEAFRQGHVPALGEGALRELVAVCLGDDPGDRPTSGVALLERLTAEVIGDEGELVTLIPEAIERAREGARAAPRKIRVLDRHMGAAPTDLGRPKEPPKVELPPLPSVDELREPSSLDLAVQVASAVGLTTPDAEGGLQDGVTAALASALTPVPEDLAPPPDGRAHVESAVRSALTPAEPPADDADARNAEDDVEPGPEPDAPVRMRNARMTNPLGLAAISEDLEPAREAPSRGAEPAQAAEKPTASKPSGQGGKEIAAAQEKPPERPIDRVINIILAILGGMIIAYFLLSRLVGE